MVPRRRGDDGGDGGGDGGNGGSGDKSAPPQKNSHNMKITIFFFLNRPWATNHANSEEPNTRLNHTRHGIAPCGPMDHTRGGGGGGGGGSVCAECRPRDCPMSRPYVPGSRCVSDGRGGARGSRHSARGRCGTLLLPSANRLLRASSPRNSSSSYNF